MKNNPPTSRQTALTCLMRWHEGRSFAETLVDRECSRAALSTADRHLVQALVFGVLRNQTWLDHVIDSLRKGRLDLEMRLILQLGLCQLFLLGMADHAAVYETVNLAPARLRGLVNAILRNALRREKAILEEREKLPLPVLYSTPAWLVQRWTQQMEPQTVRALLHWNNTTPRLYVRANPLVPVNGMPASLAPLDRAPGWFSVDGALPLEEIKAGSLYVADPSTRYAIDLLAPRPGEEILDACAAPGGKSFAMAMCMEGKGHILSCDVEEHKLRLMEAGAERLGIECMEVRLADGRVCDEALAEKADVVVCDVPCSGLGIIRKKPDIRYKDMASLAGLPAIQSTILDNASRYVRRGGTLVYSTCTVLPEENERVTDAFLRAHPDFTYDAFALPGPIGTVEGHITLWPQRHGTDGFYICRMTRKE